MPQDKRKLFDGNYAPFGYIIDGYDIYQRLKAGDVIDSTVVGEWGQLNLVKKSPSFSNVMQGEEET
jgi:cyclophilin family peptidyl-prolyl cis-trans isomerase